MKKMININFQGRVIPIEETSFDILKNYIESLRVYFDKEEGRDEIINDIESRIAELFSERLKNKVCITDEDVNTIIKDMGRPQDFEDAELSGNYNANAKSPEGEKVAPEIRHWCRSANDSILGGVCGGIANYLKIDPSVVRVLFVLFGIGSFGFWALVYIILWIILPARQLVANARKRFYRSTDHRVFGGVAGGVAAYFGVDAWIPRLIFAAPLLVNVLLSRRLSLPFFRNTYISFNGGLTATFIIVYIILWIILPLARSASEKLAMKGEEVNLQSIKQAIQEEPATTITARTSDTQEFGFVLGRVFVILFKVLLIIIAGSIALGLLTALIALLFGRIAWGNRILPFKDFIVETAWQDFLLWPSLILFFAVPAVALLTWLIRRLMGIRSKRHYLAYVFGTLWILGFISTIVLLASVSKSFTIMESVEESVPVSSPLNDKLYVKVESELSEYNKYIQKRVRRGFPLLGVTNDSLFLNNVRIEIIKSGDSAYHAHKLTSSTGVDSRSATFRAQQVRFPIFQKDNNLVLSPGFTISSKDKFRNQQVLIIIEVPIGKKIEINYTNSFDSFYIGFKENRWGANWYEEWRGSQYHWRSGIEYTMTEDGLKKTVREKEIKPSEQERRKRDRINTKIDTAS